MKLERYYLLERNIKNSSQTIKEKAYQSLVIPLLEYSAAVWDPQSIQIDINKVQMVQRRTTRWTLTKYHNTPNATSMFDYLA